MARVKQGRAYQPETGRVGPICAARALEGIGGLPGWLCLKPGAAPGAKSHRRLTWPLA